MKLFYCLLKKTIVSFKRTLCVYLRTNVTITERRNQKKNEYCASICHKDSHEDSGKGVAHVVSIISEALEIERWKFFPWLFEIAGCTRRTCPTGKYVHSMYIFIQQIQRYMHKMYQICTKFNARTHTHTHLYSELRFTIGTRLFVCDKSRYRK